MKSEFCTLPGAGATEMYEIGPSLIEFMVKYVKWSESLATQAGAHSNKACEEEKC